MKKFRTVLSSVAFLLIFAIILCVLSLIFLPKNNDEESGMSEPLANGILGEKDNTIDVAIIGDSIAMTGISPLQLWDSHGYTSYVASSFAQPLYFSQTLLHRSFINQKPKYIFLEVNGIYREFGYLDAVTHEVGKILPIIEYHDRWKSLSSKDFSFSYDCTYTDKFKGFDFDTAIEGDVDLSYMSETDQIAPIPETNKKYVENIKSYCKQNGAELIFFSVPSATNWNSARHNGIVRYADELGLTYIDMNVYCDEIGLDWSVDTRDNGDHLNIYGAEKVTAYLGEWMSENCELQDHRGDSAYKSFDDALTVYNSLDK